MLRVILVGQPENSRATSFPSIVGIMLGSASVGLCQNLLVNRASSFALDKSNFGTFFTA